MKAALITGLNQLEIREIPDPLLPYGGVIVKMVSAAICGTDVKMLLNGHRDLVLPRIPGHEGAGVVIETDNESFKTGDVVAVYPGIYCGRCLNCLDGNTSRCDSIKIYGFNQDGLFRALVPFDSNEIKSLVHVRESGNIENMALAEPLACCISAYNKVHVKNGSALIIGAGSVGSIFAALLLSKGFNEVVVIDRERQKLEGQIPVNAKTIETDVNSIESSLKAHNHVRGFDLIVPCCPDGLNWDFWRFMKPGGSALLFSGNNRGVDNNNIDMNEIHYRELVLAGSYGCNARDFRDAIRMIEDDEIDLSFLSPRFASLDEIPECISALKNSTVKKVIINKF
ncbi:MAG: alcohol dehydrogenase catalytic domain-containing protein [Desulfatiglans sp.]|jgi:L-iditol 2-dehydrogenase|nr:alcohol dehydrogenase catalytic domain-containing protein [Desulfatiglans sp.]